jgi:polyisoprenoid-binding protein YceI
MSTELHTEQGMVRVPAGTWDVDPAHSSAAFEVKHMMIATVRGHFGEIGGAIEAAPDDPSNSRVTGWAKVASIDTGNADRDAHLRSPDFFDAERYPEIRYESTRIQWVEGGTYRLFGNITIKDTTREVEMTAEVQGVGEDPWGNQRVGIAARGSINRTEFGLTWQQKLAAGGLLVGEEVKVILDISAIKR